MKRWGAIGLACIFFTVVAYLSVGRAGVVRQRAIRKMFSGAYTLKRTVYDHGTQVFDLMSVYPDGTFRWIIPPANYKEDAYGVWVNGNWMANGNDLTLTPTHVDGETRAQIAKALQTGDIPAIYSNRIDRLFQPRSFHMQFYENGAKLALVASATESSQWLGKGYPPGPLSFQPDGPR